MPSSHARTLASTRACAYVSDFIAIFAVSAGVVGSGANGIAALPLHRIRIQSHRHTHTSVVAFAPKISGIIQSA